MGPMDPLGRMGRRSTGMAERMVAERLVVARVACERFPARELDRSFEQQRRTREPSPRRESPSAPGRRPRRRPEDAAPP